MTFFIPRREEFWQRKPTGKVELKESHESAAGLMSYWLFRPEDTFYDPTGNVINGDFTTYDFAQRKPLNITVDYARYYQHASNDLGDYLSLAAGVNANKLLADNVSAIGWQSMGENQAYSLLGSGPLHSLAGVKIHGGTRTQFESTAFSATSQTMRCINNANWTAGADETFSEDLWVGKELFNGMAFSGADNKRICYFGDDAATRTNFTGTIAADEVINLFVSQATGRGVGVRWFGAWDRLVGENEARELKNAPYQVFQGRRTIIAMPSGAVDTTAPVLSSPTGTKTGSTTADGTVSTDEANGTLYYLASENATETAATIKTGSSQAVTATGSQAVSVTGLTPSTVYYLHYVHDDAASNESNVQTSASFTTDAASSFQAAWATKTNKLLGSGFR